MFPPKEFSPAVRDFLSRYVRSVEQLEILLLLAREPARQWAAREVYDSILSTPSSVERWLNELAGHGLVEKSASPTPVYRCCTDADLRNQVMAVADIYRTSPVRVIEAIYRRDTNAAQSFADAFKFKTNEPNS